MHALPVSVRVDCLNDLHQRELTLEQDRLALENAQLRAALNSGIQE